jgi:hypothetical protein
LAVGGKPNPSFAADNEAGYAAKPTCGGRRRPTTDAMLDTGFATIATIRIAFELLALTAR